MDTDDLSKEAYKAIIIESEKFNHDLTLQFGVLADQCEDEEDYLASSLKLVQELRKMNKEYLSDIFFDELPDEKALFKVLDRIEKNILKVKEIPKEKRHYDF